MFGLGAIVWLVPFFTATPGIAQAVNAINKAETLTCTMTTYMREYSEDGKRTWLRKSRMDIAYQAPNLYRDTRYDADGNVRWVEIVDNMSNKTLQLDMKAKTATWKAHSSNQYGPGKPLAWVATALEREPIELVGQWKINGVKVNVFRFHRGYDHTSVDIWLDVKTKRLVEFCEPGADCFDPTTAPDRDNPPEKRISKGEIAGSVGSDIVFDAQLDRKSFSLVPPEGFQVVQEPPTPTVTEAELIEWLGVTARFNNDTFVDTEKGVDHEKQNKAAQKNKADRTDVEQRYLDLWRKHVLGNRHSYPIWDFAKEYAVPGSFRYLGKGVKLGSGDRIVCWYKLKSTGTYRAVYGDLTVKDVEPRRPPVGRR